MLKSLALIPARGGSKGVKNKNIRKVAGEPLISHSIHCANSSKKLTKSVVSTDDLKIKDIAENYGSEVLIRPDFLARDDTPIVPVINYVIEQLYIKSSEKFDIIIILQPTSPIRTGKQLDEVINMFEEDKNLEEVVSVVPMDEIHPARMYNLSKDNFLIPINSDLEKSRRQKLPIVYYRNGCIYAIKTKSLLEKKSLMNANKKAFIMPLSWLANIDDERDLIIADVLMKKWKEGKL